MRPVAGTVGLAGTLAAAAVLLPASSAASGRVSLHSFGPGGTVTAYGMRFRCHRSCSMSAAPGSDVLLEARPNRFFSFSHWAGACRGRAPGCVLSLASATSVRAVFRRNRSDVLVVVGGAGSVRGVGRSKARCGAGSRSCDISWPAGTTVKLAAVPDAGGSFGGWGGACAVSSGHICRIVVGNRSISDVSAAFATTLAASGDEQQLEVRAGNTPGSALHSSLPGFACRERSKCSTQVATGTLVKLKADIGDGFGATSWRGACVGRGPACAFVVDGTTTVVGPSSPLPATDTATFGLTVRVLGNGVVTDGHKLSCRKTSGLSSCQGTYDGSVRLTARPASGNAFSKWVSPTRVCHGTQTSCTTNVNGASGAWVAAFFTPKR